MENPFKKTVDKQNEITNEEILEQETEDSNNTEEVVEEATEESTNEKNEWQEKYETLNNQYIRLAADFDNFRKRQEAERESLLKYGAENTVKKLIEVIDNFDRGLKAIETVEDCEKVKECYQLAYKNFNDVLGKIGLETIPAEGEVFDPSTIKIINGTNIKKLEELGVLTHLQEENQMSLF